MNLNQIKHSCLLTKSMIHKYLIKYNKKQKKLNK